MHELRIRYTVILSRIPLFTRVLNYNLCIPQDLVMKTRSNLHLRYSNFIPSHVGGSSALNNKYGVCTIVIRQFGFLAINLYASPSHWYFIVPNSKWTYTFGLILLNIAADIISCSEESYIKSNILKQTKFVLEYVCMYDANRNPQL